MISRIFSVETLSGTFGEWLSKNINNHEQAVLLAYGTEILLCTLIKAILIIVLSSILGIVWETLLIIISASVLRLLSGGAHATAYYRCLIISLIVFLSLGYSLSIFAPIIANDNFHYLNIFMLPGLYFTIRYAPTPHASKLPITSQVKRTRKLYSILIYLVAMLAVFISLEWWILAIATGFAWQSFTLSPSGNIIIHCLDTFLKRLNGKEVFKNEISNTSGL